MSILVVDDTLEVREMLSVLLESAGYRDLLFAESAEAAFERLGMGGSGALLPALPSLRTPLYLMD